MSQRIYLFEYHMSMYHSLGCIKCFNQFEKEMIIQGKWLFNVNRKGLHLKSYPKRRWLQCTWSWGLICKGWLLFTKLQQDIKVEPKSNNNYSKAELQLNKKNEWNVYDIDNNKKSPPLRQAWHTGVVKIRFYWQNKTDAMFNCPLFSKVPKNCLCL